MLINTGFNLTNCNIENDRILSNGQTIDIYYVGSEVNYTDSTMVLKLHMLKIKITLLLGAIVTLFLLPEMITRGTILARIAMAIVIGVYYSFFVVMAVITHRKIRHPIRWKINGCYHLYLEQNDGEEGYKLMKELEGRYH